MRDIILLTGFVSMLMAGRVFIYPHVGVLIWAWTAMVIPNNYAWGFASGVRYNLLIAVMTLLFWFFSKDQKSLPKNGVVILLIAFLLLGTLSTVFAIASPELVYLQFDKFLKIVLFSLVVSALINTKERIEALMYAVLLSLGFHGFVSGAKFLASMGTSHIYGPSFSIISDNNHFALAMIALLPIIGYLYQQSLSKLLRYMLLGAMVLVIFTIMGTFSRGGLLGILAVGLLIFVRSEQKTRLALVLLPVVVMALLFAPERWYSRMDTITEATQDYSFMGRVIAWKQSTLIAMDHPVLGGGFHAVQDFNVWQKYFFDFDRLRFIPTDYPDPFSAHAAHSIYFQVLGDLGFLGLALFLSILWVSWRNATYIRKVTKHHQPLEWAHKLATAMQYSMFAYIVSGAALSMAYFDFMYMIFGVLAAMRKLVSHKVGNIDRALLKA